MHKIIVQITWTTKQHLIEALANSPKGILRRGKEIAFV